MSMRTKAISPMIATVLLIAFTVAVGGILSLWLTGYTTTTTGAVETATTNQTKCVGTYIDVISVTDTSVIITIRGSQTISNVRCRDSSGNNITTVGIVSLAPGASNAGAWTRSSNASYICTGSCLNIGVTGECKSGQTCWK